MARTTMVNAYAQHFELSVVTDKISTAAAAYLGGASALLWINCSVAATVIGPDNHAHAQLYGLNVVSGNVSTAAAAYLGGSTAAWW